MLVDRIWPRSIRKEELKPDRWMRGIAPSNELRHWPPAGRGPLTLLCGARDEERNQTVVPRQVLLERIKSQGGST